MANVNIDVNSWLPFALRWLFAGLWGSIGWALSVTYVIPMLPGV